MPIPMHEFVDCVASTMVENAQENQENFQPLDRTRSENQRLRFTKPCSNRLSYQRPSKYTISNWARILFDCIVIWLVKLWGGNPGVLINIHTFYAKVTRNPNINFVYVRKISKEVFQELRREMNQLETDISIIKKKKKENLFRQYSTKLILGCWTRTRKLA